MGGRGSGSNMAGGGSRGYNVSDNMTPQQIRDMQIRLANDANKARQDMNQQMDDLGQAMKNGDIPVSQLASKMESINAEYERKMKSIRRANNALSAKYNVHLPI